MTMAYLEVKVLTVLILQRFRILPAADSPHKAGIRYNLGMTLSAEGGMPLCVEQR
jgi:hypothetical protein